MSITHCGRITEDGGEQTVVIDGGMAFTIPASVKYRSLSELINYSKCGMSLRQHLEEMKYKALEAGDCRPLEIKSKVSRHATSVIPKEIWAVGVTYKRQVAEHEKDAANRKAPQLGIYEYVHKSKRAEVFFKGFERTCSRSNEDLFLRRDAGQVLPEAELVAVLGLEGGIVGYVLGNDLTAWDIELECPLFLNQAKIWNRSCSIGALMRVADDTFDPYDQTINCKVLRNGQEVINSSGVTSELARTIESMRDCLILDNDVPPESLLFTGTCCVVPHDFRLCAGDIVNIECEGLGVLTNVVSQSTSYSR